MVRGAAGSRTRGLVALGFVLSLGVVSFGGCVGDDPTLVPGTTADADGGVGEGGATSEDAAAPAPPKPTGIACQSEGECTAQQQCNQELRCENGECIEYKPPCADPTPNDCTTLACTGGTCLQFDLPDGSGCDDGNACTENDTCTSGACGGTPKKSACKTGEQCNPATGACTCAPGLGTKCATGCFRDCCPGSPPTNESCDPCGRKICDANGNWACKGDVPASNCTNQNDCNALVTCPVGQFSRCEAYYNSGNMTTNKFVCTCGGCRQ